MFYLGVCGRCVAVPCALLRTALNLALPSSTPLGPQQMMMLEAMHARMPQIAPMMPGTQRPKPSIEKMELARKQVVSGEVSTHVHPGR